jgi:Skp family chaperone for outer membrane proteins
LSSQSSWPLQVPPAHPRVAVLDIQKATASTNEGKTATNDLHLKFDPEVAKLEQERLKIEEMKQRMLSIDFIDFRGTAAKDLDARLKRYRRNSEDSRQTFEAEQKRVLAELTAKLMVVATDYAKQNHFEVVIDGSTVLWRAGQTDITDKVIELYDLKYR